MEAAALLDVFSCHHQIRPAVGGCRSTRLHATPFGRADWQTTCAVLVSSNPPGGDRQLPALDLVPVPNQPRPLSISNPSPALMHGSQLCVAYQGVPDAYSEAAAAKVYPGCDAIPCDQFEVAFQAVELWIANRAVLPVENSLGGSIHRNYDLLLRHRLHIICEVQLPVHHCLLALPGMRKELLARVISHPQALAQCELTLNAMGLNVAREAFDDTAGAAEHVAAAALRDTAAIALARAAELYGLHFLADGIQDDAGNVTRFVMLAREPIIPRTDRPIKTSIVFAHDGGHLRALQGALGVRVQGHQPHQDREPPAPPPTHPPRRRCQRRNGQALRVHVLDRLPGVHGRRARAEHARGDPGVHLVPQGAGKLPHGHDAMGHRNVIVAHAQGHGQ